MDKTITQQLQNWSKKLITLAQKIDDAERRLDDACYDLELYNTLGAPDISDIKKEKEKLISIAMERYELVSEIRYISIEMDSLQPRLLEEVIGARAIEIKEQWRIS